MSWRTEAVDDIMSWLDGYISRRYGNWTQGAHDAWGLLLGAAYQFHWSSSYARSVITHQPGNHGIDKNFDAGNISEAWRLLLTEAINNTLDPSVGPLRYDIVDIGRQVLTNLFTDLNTMLEDTYAVYVNTSDMSLVEDIQYISFKMLQIIQDLDAFLATDTNFLLGHWISEAVASAAPSSLPDVLKSLSFNARNQITMWGPNRNIEDYASKQWSGMFSDYFSMRWKLYVDIMLYSIKHNKSGFIDDFHTQLFKFESDWSSETKSFPTTTQGDTIDVATKLLAKYYNGRDYLKQNYNIMVNKDIEGSNLYGQSFSLWTNMDEQLVWLCEMHPKCVGFTLPNLYFKSSSANIKTAVGTTLYLKKKLN